MITSHRSSSQLVYYDKERDKYQAAYLVLLTDAEAKDIVGKLCRHFMKIPKGFHANSSFVGCGLRKPKVIFYGNRGARVRFTMWGIEVRLPQNPSLGMICHEVGHLVERYNRRYSKTKVSRNARPHTKRLLRIVGWIIGYAMKNKLWRA